MLRIANRHFIYEPAFPETLKIRVASPEDLDSLEFIEKEAFEVGPYTRSMLKRMLAMPGSFHFVAEDGDSVLGYVSIIPIGDGAADVESIAVDPAQQGMGVGGQLLSRAEEEMRARGFTTSILEVRDMNSESIAFYEKHGYEKIKHLRSYYHEKYRGSRGAFRMRKAL